MPLRHPFLLFGPLSADQPGWLGLWQKLEAKPSVEEILRNFPVRQPLLWMDLP